MILVFVFFFCLCNLDISRHLLGNLCLICEWGRSQKVPSGNYDLKELQKCIFLFCPFKCKYIYIHIYILSAIFFEYLSDQNHRTNFHILKNKEYKSNFVPSSNNCSPSVLSISTGLPKHFLWLCKTWTFLFESCTSFLITHSSSYKKRNSLLLVWVRI